MTTADQLTTQERICIPPQYGLLVLQLSLSFGFVAFGVWLIVDHWHDFRANLIGPISVAFFGWAGWLIVLRIRSNYRTVISAEGVTIPGPTFRAKLIRWADIEGITSLKIGSNGFTGIKLTSGVNLISQYSEDEIRTLLRTNRWLGWGNRTFGPMSLAQSGFEKAYEATKPCDNLAAYFAQKRRAYGCEILLRRIDRDRSAEDFAAYLEEFRQHYSKQIIGATDREALHA